MATLTTCTSSTRPGAPDLGDMLYETDTGKVIICSNATGPEFKVYDSNTSPYNLDATNTVSSRPLFHFDAALWNGADATDNPDDSTTLDGDETWTDRAHGLTTVGQATANYQPEYKTSGENSKPYVLSDSDDRLLLAAPQSCRGTFTIFVVAKATSAQKICPVGSNLYNAVEGDRTVWFAWSGEKDYLFYGNTGTVNGSHTTGLYTDTTMPFLVIRDSSNNTKIYHEGDNVASITATATIPIVMTQLMFGGAYGTIGDFYEVAVWDSHLSDANLNEIGDYVIAKYGIDFTDF